MDTSAQPSFIKRQIRRAGAGSSFIGYLVSLSVQAIIFFISLKLRGESEALFALIYVMSSVLSGILIGRGPAILAGVIASVSVDYHYIHPEGQLLTSPASLIFLILTCTIVQIALYAVRMLHSVAQDAENAKHKLELAVQAKEEILSIVAHDLRQPLVSFSIKQQMAIRSLKSGHIDDTERFLQTGKLALEQMDQLIQDLLDGTKLENGKLSLALEEVDFQELIENVYGLFLQQAKAKNIQVEMSYPSGESPHAYIDSHRITRVISNLLSNALKFTPSGGKIEILVSLLNAKGFEVKVMDSGPGIQKDDVKMLFQKHWQEKGTAHLGTGLGLYICKGVMEAHRGKIWYERSPLGGSSFCFTLSAIAESANQLQH